ncbi:MAG: LEA type 2 family protein [Methylohalobius sp. ZOD2]
MRALSMFGLCGFLLFWLTGCANLSTFEQPRVSVVDVQLRGGKLLAQDFLVTLRVDNPNAYGFDINGVVADVLLNDQPLARGLAEHEISVPAYGRQDVDVIATVQTLGLLKQIVELGTRRPIDYQVRGHLSVGRGWTRDIRVPFEEQGTLDFWRFIGEQAVPRPLEDDY